jgi:uncharacterized protein
LAIEKQATAARLVSRPADVRRVFQKSRLPEMSRVPGTPRLRSFLEHPTRPVGTLRYHELQGFLFTVASAPELVRPSEWMPIVFGDHEAGYASLDEAETVLEELMSLYNSINEAVGEARAALPADCAFRNPTLANLDDRAPVAEWSRGFLRGHQWLEESWEPYVPESLEEEFSANLMALSFFASRKIADAFAAETKQQDVSALAKIIRRVFPDAVAQYAHLGRSIHKALIEEQGVQTEPRRTVKIGRNDPCPCGSGRKHKKCCGAGVM